MEPDKLSLQKGTWSKPGPPDPNVTPRERLLAETDAKAPPEPPPGTARSPPGAAGFLGPRLGPEANRVEPYEWRP